MEMVWEANAISEEQPIQRRVSGAARVSLMGLAMVALWVGGELLGVVAIVEVGDAAEDDEDERRRIKGSFKLGSR